MCFFYSLPKKAKAIAKRYNKQLTLFDDTEFEDKYLIKGYDHTNSNFIITADNNLHVAKWGLIPFWSKPDYADIVIKENRNVNAKEETIFTLPSFRVPIKHHRCLVPASGWYEYHYEKGKVKDIYYIFVKDVEIFSFAGIYDVWRDKETGKDITTYAIITSSANELMTFIHNGGSNPHRMPVILNEKDEDKWLDPNTTQEELELLMQPYPDKLIDAYPIKYSPQKFRVASAFDADLVITK